MSIDNYGAIEGVILSSDNDETNQLDIKKWFTSAINGDYKTIKELCKENTLYLGVRGEGSMTALMYAAGSGQGEVVSFLLKKDEEVRKQNSEGNSALMYAALNGFVDCVKKLMFLESELLNNEGKNAYDFAIQGGNKDCIKLLKFLNDTGSSNSKGNAAVAVDGGNLLVNLIEASVELGEKIQVLESAHKAQKQDKSQGQKR